MVAVGGLVVRGRAIHHARLDAGAPAGALATGPIGGQGHGVVVEAERSLDVHRLAQQGLQVGRDRPARVRGDGGLADAVFVREARRRVEEAEWAPVIDRAGALELHLAREGRNVLHLQPTEVVGGQVAVNPVAPAIIRVELAQPGLGVPLAVLGGDERGVLALVVEQLLVLLAGHGELGVVQVVVLAAEHHVPEGVAGDRAEHGVAVQERAPPQLEIARHVDVGPPDAAVVGAPAVGRVRVVVPGGVAGLVHVGVIQIAEVAVVALGVSDIAVRVVARVAHQLELLGVRHGRVRAGRLDPHPGAGAVGRLVLEQVVVRADRRQGLDGLDRLGLEEHAQARRAARLLVRADVGLGQLGQVRIGEVIHAMEGHVLVDAEVLVIPVRPEALVVDLAHELVGRVGDVAQADDHVAVLEPLGGVGAGLNADHRAGGRGELGGHLGHVGDGVAAVGAAVVVLERALERPHAHPAVHAHAFPVLAGLPFGALLAHVAEVAIIEERRAPEGVAIAAVVEVVDVIVDRHQRLDLHIFGHATVGVPVLEVIAHAAQHDLAFLIRRRGLLVDVVGLVGVDPQLDGVAGVVLHPVGVRDQPGLRAVFGVFPAAGRHAPHAGEVAEVTVMGRHLGGVRVVAQRDHGEEVGVIVDDHGVLALARDHVVQERAQRQLRLRDAGAYTGFFVVLDVAQRVVVLIGERIRLLLLVEGGRGGGMGHRAAVGRIRGVGLVAVAGVPVPTLAAALGEAGVLAGAIHARAEVDVVERHGVDARDVRAGAVAAVDVGPVVVVVVQRGVVGVAAVRRDVHVAADHVQPGGGGGEVGRRARAVVAVQRGVLVRVARVGGVGELPHADAVDLVGLRRQDHDRHALEDVGDRRQRHGAGFGRRRGGAVGQEDAHRHLPGALVARERLDPDLAHVAVALGGGRVVADGRGGVGDGVGRQLERVGRVRLAVVVQLGRAVGRGVRLHLLDDLGGLLQREGAIALLLVGLDGGRLEHGEAHHDRAQDDGRDDHLHQGCSNALHAHSSAMTRSAERRSRY
ncbi:hypothetical protein D3C72_700990 [compost metagenome]